MSGPLLEVEGLRKSFYGVEVLHGVSFDVAAGEALGLVGENGSGKSTSMNVLGGVLRPDGGAMRLGGCPYRPSAPQDASAAGLGFIHQELNLFPNLTIEENFFVDGFPRRRWLPLIDRGAMRRRTREMLDLVELDLSPATPVSCLSQGERQLVEIAKTLARDARLIIFDEPTTSLSRPEVRRLFDLISRLKERRIAVIYISHALEDVLTICDRVAVLRDGDLVGTRDAGEVEMPELIAMMVGRSIDTVFPPRAATRRDEVLLSARGVSQPGVVEGISFDLHAGEVLGLAGLMGSGRSELARILFGLDPFAAGEIRAGGRVLAGHGAAEAMEAGLAFLTENRREEGLLMEASVTDNVVLASLEELAGRLGLLDRRAAGRRAGETAQRVRLSTEAVDETLAKHLSGGNQQKVVIGKWLMRGPRVFILDEPTRGIDVGAKQEVYRIVNALVEAGAAVLLISSEIEELVGLSDRILTIRRGELGPAFERTAFDREAIMAAATGAALAEPAPLREAIA